MVGMMRGQVNERCGVVVGLYDFQKLTEMEENAKRANSLDTSCFEARVIVLKTLPRTFHWWVATGALFLSQRQP